MRKRKPKLVSNMQIGVSAQTVVSFPTGNSRIAVGLTLLAVYGLFDDICNRIIVGLQCLTKRGKTYAPIIRAEEAGHRASTDCKASRKASRYDLPYR